jgi:hypothetical protein
LAFGCEINVNSDENERRLVNYSFKVRIGVSPLVPFDRTAQYQKDPPPPTSPLACVCARKILELFILSEILIPIPPQSPRRAFCVTTYFESYRKSKSTTLMILGKYSRRFELFL